MFKTIDSLLEFTNETKFKRLYRSETATTTTEQNKNWNWKSRERESKKRRISICTSELCQEQWNEKKSMRQTMKFQLIGRRAEMRFVPNTLKKQLKMVHSKYAHTFSNFEHFKKTSARILCVMTGWEKRTKEFENLTKIKSARFA